MSEIAASGKTPVKVTVSVLSGVIVAAEQPVNVQVLASPAAPLPVYAGTTVFATKPAGKFGVNATAAGFADVGSLTMVNTYVTLGVAVVGLISAVAWFVFVSVRIALRLTVTVGVALMVGAGVLSTVMLGANDFVAVPLGNALFVVSLDANFPVTV